VDGNYWVIYTHANYKVMQYTDHEDEYDDHGYLPRNWCKAAAVVAFYAMKADVMEKYQELVEAFENREEDEDDNTDNTDTTTDTKED
jgi:hypothetical protein